jgi:hypothetical protein
MRDSSLWSAIKVDGDVFIEGFLGLTWFPSDEAKRNRDNWEKSVDSIITTLSKRVSSWAVMKALSDSGHTLTIVPNPVVECNATTFPKSAQDAARKGAEAEHCSKAVKGDNAGTGKGTNSKIVFSPGPFAKNGMCSAKGAGRDADEILFHEITHAMRYATGQRNACFSTPFGYADYEEFVAVLFTNVYSSETSRTLRKDHQGYEKMPATTSLFNSKAEKEQVNLHDAAAFCKWFRPKLENVAKYQQTLAKRIADCRHIRWNPFQYL